MVMKQATDDSNSSDLTITIIKRVIRRMRREGAHSRSKWCARRSRISNPSRTWPTKPPLQW